MGASSQVRGRSRRFASASYRERNPPAPSTTVLVVELQAADDEVIVAVDAGTSGVRSLAFDLTGAVVAGAHRELTQHFPSPGLVEHDPSEIWHLTQHTLGEVAAQLSATRRRVCAVGITNQRETAVAWDTASGAPHGRAIVWQDRRTAARCAELERAGHLSMVRARTGLVLDPYFSATKWAWMFEHGGLVVHRDLALGTVDDWLCWNLTGGTDAGRHATEPSNASRTLCYDIVERQWSPELCELFGVPIGALGEIRPSTGRFGSISPAAAGDLFSGVPVSGIAGDQQAALFGQACHRAGETKVTYGTGCFVLMNLGERLPSVADGLLTTVAWDLGSDEGLTYALEGAVFSAGATIQWLRDGLGIIEQSVDVGPLAAAIEHNDGVYLVPAFTGLGSPWWEPEARGIVVGITRGTSRAHFARAAVESIAYQCRDVVDAMSEAAGRDVEILRADGGAAVMDLLLELQAAQCGSPVVRASTTEATALGAAMLAGLGEGRFRSLEEAACLARVDRRFDPPTDRTRAERDYRGWRDALQRAIGAR